MLTISSPAMLAFGFVLGLRHALDADHVAAVSTIVSERKSVLGSAVVGAVWGLGHTAALLVVAVLMIGLRLRMPPSMARGLELAVAAMLVALGLNLLLRGPARATRPRSNRRPFVVGLLHGLAGSAGVMLAALATIPSVPLAFAYVGTFGLGSVGGMMAMSAVLGVPIAVAATRFGRAERWLQTCAAVGSVAVGVALAWEVGVATGIPT